MTSKLDAECQDALLALVNLNEVTLIWVPRYHGILGNEEADNLARQASAASPLGPELVLGIPKCLARAAIKNWAKLRHLNKWIHMPGCKHGKLFKGRPCKKRADDLLKLNRHQPKLVVAIPTGHAPVRGHLRTIGLFDGDPSCRVCGMETETLQRLVCRCEALSRQRYNVLGELLNQKTYVQLQSETCAPSSKTQGYLNCAEWSV